MINIQILFLSQTNQYHHWNIFKKEISDFAIALQNEKVRGDYYRSEKTKVDESARQIIKGTYGLIIEKIVNQVATGRDYDNSPLIFLPIIVTNANLFLCNFDLDDIDSKTGHITKDPEFKPVDSIIYDYPAPKEVQFPNPLASNLTAEFRDHVSKWHVLIMNPGGFVDFLDDVDKIKTMQ